MHAMARPGDGRDIFDYCGGCSLKVTRIILHACSKAVFVRQVPWEADFGNVRVKQTVTRKRQIDAAGALR